MEAYSVSKWVSSPSNRAYPRHEHFIAEIILSWGLNQDGSLPE